MTSVVEDCVPHCLLSDGQPALYDTLPSFDEDLGGNVTAEELSLPAPLEAIDESQSGSGSSLPATPAERPGTFCPSSLPLPPATCPNRATLVLDLDGTLIASEELNAATSAYLWNPHAGARAPDYEAMGRRVWLRPGVKEFLAAVRPHFEIVLFTAATQNWAATAVEQLDPAAELFDVMLHRDHTTSDLMWDYVKDLSRLGRDLSRVVIVDDNPLMFMYQPDNALHVAAYEASTAGGPDNVLERVTDVLISQVAVAEDVREVLGPMASAKSCICSTISAAPTTAAAASDACGLHVPATSQQAAQAPEQSFEDGHTTTPPAADADGTCQASDSVSIAMECAGEVGAETCVADNEGQDSGALLDAKGSGHDVNQPQQVPQQADGAERVLQDESADHAGCAANEETAAWDADSDGAEQTFDANGAAVPLGAETGASSYRHWEQCHGLDHCELSGGASQAATGSEGGEQESDASPASEEPYEGQTEHSSEDFEALMDDAIAEYDSDAYEDRYDKELGYDGVCPADTAAAASSIDLCGGMYSCGGFGSLGGRSLFSGEGSRYRCSSTSRPDSYEPLYAGAPAGDTHDVTEMGQVGSNGLNAPLPFSLFQIDAHADMDAETGAVKSIGGCNVAAVTTGSQVSYELLTGTEAASGAKGSSAASAGADGQQLQPRHSSLPTGMVFLTDLNPSLGTSLSGCVHGSTDGDEGRDGSAAAAQHAPALEAVCSAPRLGCKRPREDGTTSTAVPGKCEQHNGGSGLCVAATDDSSSRHCRLRSDEAQGGHVAVCPGEGGTCATGQSDSVAIANGQQS